MFYLCTRFRPRATTTTNRAAKQAALKSRPKGRRKEQVAWGCEKNSILRPFFM